MWFDATIGGKTERIEVREDRGLYRVSIGGKVLDLDLVRTSSTDFSVLVDGLSYDLSLEKTARGFGVVVRGDRFDIDIKDAVKGAVLGAVAHGGPLRLTAPMPGKIVRVLSANGDRVEAGQSLLVMEAMKMENEMKATRAGTVQEVRVAEGQVVEMGAVLLVIL